MQKITKELLQTLSAKAEASERKRVIHSFHVEPADTIQRMLNIMQPETYSRPHKHLKPVKREAFILLTGEVAVVEFDEKGELTERIILSHDAGNYGAEITPGVWHALVCLEKDSVLYEVKDGPYVEADDKVFAPWSPEEYSREASGYLEELRTKVI